MTCFSFNDRPEAELRVLRWAVEVPAALPNPEEQEKKEVQEKVKQNKNAEVVADLVDPSQEYVSISEQMEQKAEKDSAMLNQEIGKTQKEVLSMREEVKKGILDAQEIAKRRDAEAKAARETTSTLMLEDRAPAPSQSAMKNSVEISAKGGAETVAKAGVEAQQKAKNAQAETGVPEERNTSGAA